MPTQANTPPTNAEPGEPTAAHGGTYEATDDELKELVAEALLIAAIERRQAKAAEQQANPPKKRQRIEGRGRYRADARSFL